MIKIVKLQHFATNGKTISFDSSDANSNRNVGSSINLDVNYYTKNSSSNDKEKNTQAPPKPQKPDFEKLKQLLNEEENKQRKMSPRLTVPPVNRDQFVITNSLIPDEKSSKSKNNANVSRSKSAVDMPTAKYAAQKSLSNVGENASDIVNSQNTNQKSILKKQSFKDKKILEWAKKKSLTIKELSKLSESTELDSLLVTPKDKTASTKPSPNKGNHTPSKKEDEDDYLNLGDAAAAVIQKSDIERNLRMKLFESQLIDLSKARFKTLEMVDHQKKLFIDQQLKKARSLPGLLRFYFKKFFKNFLENFFGFFADVQLYNLVKFKPIRLI